MLLIGFLLLHCLVVQTDPNWSNFLYDESSNTINLIDFGAARDYPRSFVDNYLGMVSSLPCAVYSYFRLGNFIEKLC